jgi:hypothetical protein
MMAVSIAEKAKERAMKARMAAQIREIVREIIVRPRASTSMLWMRFKGTCARAERVFLYRWTRPSPGVSEALIMYPPIVSDSLLSRLSLKAS